MSDLQANRRNPGDQDQPQAPNQELLQVCAQLALPAIDQAFRETWLRMPDELTRQVLSSLTRDEQQDCLDAMTMLKLYQVKLEAACRSEMASVYDSWLRGAPTVAGAQTPLADAKDPGSLQLLDDSGVDDTIYLQRIAGRLRRHLDNEHVQGLRARLAHIAARPWFEDNTLPIAPEAVLLALQQATCGLAVSPGAVRRLMSASEPLMGPRLAALYKGLNERLIGAGILPVIRHRLQITVSTGPVSMTHDAQPAAKPEVHGHPQKAQADGPTLAGGAQQAAASEPAPESARGESYDPFDMLPDLQFDQASATAIKPAAAPVKSAHHVGSTPNLVDLNGLLERLRRGDRQGAQARIDAFKLVSDPTWMAANAPLMAAKSDPLLRALDDIQGSGAVGASVPGDASLLIEQVAGPLQQHGSPVDHLLVDLVSVVFDYIFRDRRLPDTVKQVLGRMQIVAVKAALVDRSFFARRQHPMRRLIDQIVDLGVAPDTDVGVGSNLLTMMSRIADRLLSDYDRDASLFEKASQDLAQAAAHEQQRLADSVAPHTEALLKVEARAVSEADAKALIEQRLLGCEAPDFIGSMLRQWWVRHLALCRRGEGDETWDDAVATVDGLLWTIGPKIPADVSRLVTMLPPLVGKLQKALDGVGMPADERKRFCQGLLNHHAAVLDKARDASTLQAIERSAAPLQLDDDGLPKWRGAAFAPPAAVAAEPLVDGMGRGALVDLRDERGLIRYRVVWVSPQRLMMILAARDQPARAFKREQLLRLARAGQLKLAADEPMLIDQVAASLAA